MTRAKNYMKMGFCDVVFTDECRATLDGPDDFRRCRVANGEEPSVKKVRQQRGGGVMFRCVIYQREIIGPFRVEQGVKTNSENYCKSL